MDRWCIKPENKEQLVIIGKWFDENYSEYKPGFYQDSRLINCYFICGLGKGCVYNSAPQGRELTFIEFENEILGKNVEPVYEIY